MSTIVLWSKKIWLVFAFTALCAISTPWGNVYALAPADSTTPTPPGLKGVDRLEQAWTREQMIYGKLGSMLNTMDQRISNMQEFIDKVKSKGRDVSALQTALDNFSAAVKQAKPIYQTSTGIVNAHAGFDGNGKVSDQLQAATTVISLGGDFREIRQVLAGPGNALREAMRAFREANAPTPAPGSVQPGS